MNNDDYKKYTLQAKTGIKGEVFFESLIVDYSIPHQIVGHKDLGIDYICEWVHGDKPTGILYAVQVKTFQIKYGKPRLIASENQHNKLEEYTINNSDLKKIEERTLNYWKGLGIPVYLFAIISDETKEQFECYYKRFTPFLTNKNINMSEINFTSEFYKVNKGNKFLAFKSPVDRKNGFARDLFIDYLRWNYFKGSLTYIDPQKMGLDQFSKDKIFKDLFESYKDNIIVTYYQIKGFLERYYPGLKEDNGYSKPISQGTVTASSEIPLEYKPYNDSFESDG